MPVPSRRDQELTRARLAGWLGARFPDARGVRVTDITGPAFTGYSHETLMFEASWAGDSGERAESLVARVAPSDYSVFLEPDFEAEYRVMEVLAAHSDVPLPPALGYEADPSWLGSPFFVLGRVGGLVPADNPPYTAAGWLAEASPEQRARVWWTGLEAMAKVHAVDWKRLGLGFLARPRFGTLGFDEQLGYYERYVEWACEGQQVPETLERAMGWLRANRPGTDETVALCWGDSRIGNEIFRDFRCVAVLDWEMAALGPPEMDLAWYRYFDRVFSEGLEIPRLAGVPTPGETAARYEELTGREARDLEYYEVFAGYRFSAILLRLSALMILFGQLPPDSDFGRASFAMQFLERQLDEARAGAAP